MGIAPAAAACPPDTTAVACPPVGVPRLEVPRLLPQAGKHPPPPQPRAPAHPPPQRRPCQVTLYTAGWTNLAKLEEFANNQAAVNIGASQYPPSSADWLVCLRSGGIEVAADFCLLDLSDPDPHHAALWHGFVGDVAGVVASLAAQRCWLCLQLRVCHSASQPEKAMHNHLDTKQQ